MDVIIVLSMLALYLLLIAVGIVIYIAPTYIAFKNRHPNRWLIMAVNIGLGGTVIGWIGSLVWALNKVHLSPTGSNGGESGLNIFANDQRRVSIEPALSTTTDRAPARPNSDDDPMAKLSTLKKLHDQGLLDDEEFKRLRQPYVDRMMR